MWISLLGRTQKLYLFLVLEKEKEVESRKIPRLNVLLKISVQFTK